MAVVINKGRITVKTIDRSHRIAYLVLLLIVAVALSTALVLAGERSAESLKKSTSWNQRNTMIDARFESRISA
jgi:hypothetical protein